MRYNPEEPIFRYIRELPEEERPRNRLERLGTEPLANSELLAVVLGTKDALDVAQYLLKEAGGLHRLAQMTPMELERFPGVGSASAQRIVATLALGRRTQRAAQEARPRVSSPADAAALFRPHLEHKKQEELWVASLNTRNRLLTIECLYKGSTNSSAIRISEVLRMVMMHEAVAFLVAHNHPSGDPSPSPEDINVTRQIREAADLIDVDLLDHVIVGAGGNYVSLKERGLGFD